MRQLRRECKDSVLGMQIVYVAEIIVLRNIEDCSTNLVTSISREGTQGTLDSATGRINVRLERRGLVVRHIW